MCFPLLNTIILIWKRMLFFIALHFFVIRMGWSLGQYIARDIVVSHESHLSLRIIAVCKNGLHLPSAV